MSDKDKNGTAILIYDNQNYYFDMEDYDKVSQFYWRPNSKGYLAHWFAVYDSQGKRKSGYIYFHKHVLNLDNSRNKLDHIDRDNHNNRKTNLRECTHQENIFNSSLKEDAVRNRLLAEIKFFGKEFAPQRHLFEKYLKEGKF